MRGAIIIGLSATMLMFALSQRVKINGFDPFTSPSVDFEDIDFEECEMGSCK